jgi:organic radical activating enzyme
MSAETTYLVNEIYPCLQGEGIHMGLPSVLIRLQICNLRCTWCDTPYTHTLKSDPIDLGGTHSKQNYKRLSIENIVSDIRQHGNIHHAIISGGEPTLQNLAPLGEALRVTHTLEVESNGTQVPHRLHKSFESSHYSLFQWNISPKGKNAGQTLVPEALQHWSHLARQHSAVFFKFVLKQNEWVQDLEEVTSIVRTFELPSDRIILMAEGTSPESQTGNDWLEALCLRNGWRLTPRLHVLNHGATRGV